MDINEARQLGLEHGEQDGSVIDRQAVQNCWRRWTEAEVEAYLEGRREGAGQARAAGRAKVFSGQSVCPIVPI